MNEKFFVSIIAVYFLHKLLLILGWLLYISKIYYLYIPIHCTIVICLFIYFYVYIYCCFFSTSILLILFVAFFLLHCYFIWDNTVLLFVACIFICFSLLKKMKKKKRIKHVKEILFGSSFFFSDCSFCNSFAANFYHKLFFFFFVFLFLFCRAMQYYLNIKAKGW